MLPQVLRRIKRHLKYTNFYNCVFMTYDYNYKTLILGDKSKQNMALVWLGVNLLQLACQLYSIHTKASGLAEKAVGITISCAYLLTILLRFEIKADVVPILLLNFILGKESMLSNIKSLVITGEIDHLLKTNFNRRFYEAVRKGCRHHFKLSVLWIGTN